MRNKNYQLNIRLTADEMGRLKENALKAKYSVSNYLRALINGNSPKEFPDLAYYTFTEEAEYVLGTLQELSTDIPRVFKTPVESVSLADYIDALNEEVLTMHQMLWDIREAMQLPGKAELPEYPDELRPS